MRIALVSAEYPPQVGGLGDYTAQLGLALQRRGHAVTVLTGPGRADTGPLPVVRVTTGWGWGLLRSLPRALRALSPDVVHIQYQAGAYRQHPAITLLPWRLRREGRRVVVTAHDLLLPYLFPKADRARQWFTGRLLGDAGAVIVTNGQDAARLTGQGDADRQRFAATGYAPHVIPIGSNIAVAPPPGYHRAAWRTGLGVGDGQLIGYFGLMSANKGVLPLVQSLALLPGVALLIIGGAATNPDEQRYDAEVRAAIAALGLDARVTWTGPCSAAAVSGHLLACDVAALPFADGASWRRGSLLAALVHGLPTITTRPHGPLDPPLLDGQHVRLIVGPAPTLIAAAAAELLGRPALRQRLARAGQALAQHFDWDRIAAQHEVVYNAPAAPRRGATPS